MTRSPSAERHCAPVFEPMEPRLLLSATDPIITEFMASNTRIADKEGDFPDWLELYNPTGAAIDLTGWHLAVSTGNLSKWHFPTGTSLGAGAYLLVFASEKDTVIQGEIHTNFKISAGGGYLGLVKPDGTTVVSSYDFPEQTADVSYGIVRDGTDTTLIGPGATGHVIVPTTDIANWNALTGVNESTWTDMTTGVGYDASQTPASPGAGTFFWGPFGPDGSWHLYEYVSTAATWTAARTAAHAKTIGGAQGHLVTIHSDAENSFIRGIISGNTWIGLTDDVARGGTEYGNTSAGGAPTEGQVPSTSPTVQRGAGFVWENGELFTYHLYNGASIWQASQPGTNANTQDYVRMGTAGTWDDGTASTSLAYVIEYDLNLASLGPNWSILEAHGATTLTTLAEADTLLGGGGTTYTAPWINYADPQNPDGGQFAGNIAFGGDTSADDENFAIQATAYVKIATAGTYTFAVNSDDGFRLTINGGTFSSCSGGAATINGGTLQRDGTTTGPSYGVISLAAGEYRVQLTYFECGGGAQVELYAAPGTKTAYDSTFKLVGDALGGGLALWDIADLVTTNIQTAMKGINPTAYVRIPFTVADPASISTLNLQMKYDDGFVAYLNGVEVARANAPGTLNYNAAATASDPDVEAHEYDNYNITAFKSALVAGTNVLAIQGLNASASDLDFLILPQLTDTHNAYNTALQRYFMTPTPRAVNGTGTSDLGPIVTNLSAPPVSPADTDDILVTATVKASLSAVQSVSLYYRVNYGTEVALTMYDDGAHGDGAAGDKVYGASIPNTASGPGQMVRWYVTATDTAAHTTRVPVIPPPPTDPTDEDRTPEYLGTMISPGLTSTLPILYWFVQNTGAATTRTGTRCSVYYLGEFYDNLFVRDRGGASTDGHKFEFNSGYDFRFALDQARVKEFNLNFRGAMDDAYVRPVLAYEAFRDIGTPACIAFPMRIQQNGALHSRGVGIFIEQVDNHFLEREGLDPDGLLYKMSNDRPAMANANEFERKSDNLDNTALQAFLTGLHLTGTAKTNFILDNVDLPAMIDYIVANNIINDNDDAQKNYYLYQDGDGVTTGSGKWTMLPWDKDLTFGMHYFFSAYMATDPQTHPFFGDSEHPKADGPNAWNWMIDAVLDIPEVKQMFLRRFRTAMDEFLGVSGTPSADRYFETRLDELYAQLSGDPQVVGALGNLTQAVANLKTLYLEARRNHLFIDHSINTAYPDYAGIPGTQVGTPTINFGAFEVSPVSGNQDEEYIELRNLNAYAVDISGWKLRGGVDYTFDKGTVIVAGGSLYVSANERAFRARTTGPRGGQGLFIQGNYNGHLSPRAEPVRLLDLQDNTVATLTYTPTTTATQQYLRVTEVMYHPADGDGYDDNDFEYIELKNIGPGSLSITNVKFTEGVTFTFPSRTLASGERVLVVANTAAFQSRYGHTYDSIIAGQFATPPGATSPGRLDNGGERITLEDPLGNTILSFSYSDNWFTQTDGLGHSLVIRDAAATDLSLWDNKDGWAASHTPGGGPGVADTADLSPDALVVNELLSHQDIDNPGDYVEFLNTSGAAIDVSGWYLSDDAANLKQYRIPDGTPLVQPGQYLLLTQYANFGYAGRPGCIVPFQFSELGDAVYLTSATAAGEFTGFQVSEEFSAAAREVPFIRYIKSTGGKDFVAAASKTPGAANSAPLVGPVIINEIVYNPANGGYEFIELRNLSGSDVLLYDPANPANTWKFTEGVDFHFPTGAVIPANGYALVVQTSPTYFRTKYGIPAGVPIFGPYVGSLSNGGETIELKSPGSPELDGTVPYYRVDQLTYGDAAPWPKAADGLGASLIRLVAGNYGNDVANWAAGQRDGAPGISSAAFDASAPTTPANLVATLNGTTRIDLVWSASSDPNSSVAYYYIYVGGRRMAATTGTSYSDTRIASGVAYSYQVSAVNRDGVESGWSIATDPTRVVGITAAAAPDANTAAVTFSEAVVRDSAQDAANYAITYAGGSIAVTAATLRPDLKTVYLTLASPLSEGVTYTVTVNNVVTKTGYTVNPNTQQTFNYVAYVPGNVLREWWLNISGTAVTDLTNNTNYPDNPTGWDELTIFEAPLNWGDTYGQRLRAYVTAPQDGAYLFWIASDDASELWLSTDENPANAVKIAYVATWTNSREWASTSNPSQQSAAITLVAGQRYYIEARQKEGSGGDNLAVGWQLPDATQERPIPGSRLTTYVPTPPTTVSVQATDSMAHEVGQEKGIWTFTRSGGSTAAALTVYYTIGGTARGADYSEDFLQSVIIPAGFASTNLDMTPIADALVEGDETVVLTLVSDRRYGIGTGSATLTILDSSSQPTVTLAASTPTAYEAGEQKGVYTFTRTGELTNPLQISYSITGTAIAADYREVLTRSITIPAASATVTLDLTPVDDTADEPNETVILTVSASPNYTVGTPSVAIVTIIDNDLPMVSVVTTDSSASETGSDKGRFTITRAGDTAVSLTATYTISGTAVQADYQETLSGSVFFGVGVTSVVIDVTPYNDAEVEGPETVILTLNSAPTTYVIGTAGGTITIADNDLPEVTIEATTATAYEAGELKGTFTFTRTGGTGSGLLVSYTITGTAAGSDYHETLTRTVAIPVGAASATIDITPVDDSTDEPNETVSLTVSTNPNYVVGSPGAATVTIIDNDLPTVGIEATDPSAAEAGQDKGRFALTRVGDLAVPLTVGYGIGGTASVGDYVETLSGSAYFGVGVNAVVIDITPVDDTVNEADEALTLTITSDAGYAIAAPGAATVTIADNKQPAVTAVAVNGHASRGPSGIDPSGSGIRTIDIAFSEAVTFGADDVELRLVTFPGGVEQLGAVITPTSVGGSGSTTMTITLPTGAAIDTWVKVTLKGSGTLRDLTSHRLDGEAKPGGTNLGYIRTAAQDLPSGDGTAGGDAVFYVGSLRGDFRSEADSEPDGQLTVEDLAGFNAAWAAKDLDADFRGAGFGVRPADGRITAGDIDGFTAVFQSGVAAGRRLDALPTGGPLGSAELIPAAPAPLVAEVPMATPPTSGDSAAASPVADPASASLEIAPAATTASGTAPADDVGGWWLDTVAAGQGGLVAAPVAAGEFAADTDRLSMVYLTTALAGSTADAALAPDGGLDTLLALPALELSL